MSTTIKSIEQICGRIKNNKGVKAWIELVEMCGVVSIPAPVAFDEADETTHHSINANIVLKADYNSVTWFGRKKDGDFSFEDDGAQDEEIVKISGTMYIPHIDGLKTYSTNQARGTEYLVLMRDENYETPRILGELANGVTIKVKEQHNPKNGYVLTIEGEVSEKPYWFRGAFENEP